MKRMSTARAGSSHAASGGEQGFWPSYADMMSAVALILFFLMLLSYIQNLITGNDLQSTQDELADTENQLAITLTQVEEAQTALDKITIDLDEAKLTLSQKEEEIAAQDAALAEQKALISDQEKSMKAAAEELEEMRGKMQSIAVLRLSILEQIRDSLVEVVGNDAKVSIGDNGNIILSESILFDVGSYRLKSDAEPALDQLSQVFQKFLSESENAQYVDSIVISGHTDSTGDDESNRILSTNRANTVLNYLMSTNNGALQNYQSYFCSAGYGATRPVADNSTTEGRAANRRIEISITLKDDSIEDIIDAYLADTADTTGSATASGSTTTGSSTAAAGTTTTSGTTTSGTGKTTGSTTASGSSKTSGSGTKR